MTPNTLDSCLRAIERDWGSISSEVVAACCGHMATLALARTDEPWVAELHRTMPASQELHRDPVHGFVLQAHSEPEGIYRAPHDHGRSWVIYAVQHGEVEMGTYGCIDGPDGSPRLVKRNAAVLRPGMAQVYLPGDVHDTLCLHGPALLLRFTERDLREEANAGRMTRYVDRGGVWTPGAA